jgi:hypothetical protein
MSCAITFLGASFAISTQPANSRLDMPGFIALEYEIVPNVNNMGDTGITQNIVSYPSWGRSVTCKSRGQADAGDPDIEFMDLPSAGMSLMLAAAEVDNQNAYAFRITWADGSIEFIRGIVTGPRYLKGANEDFRRVAFTLGLVQAPMRLQSEFHDIAAIFSGGAGFYVDLDPQYQKSYTTSNGDTLAINPGDPVGRIESIAGGLVLRQPSSPLRPVLARVPKVVGRKNMCDFSQRIGHPGTNWLSTRGNLTYVYNTSDIADPFGGNTATKCTVGPNAENAMGRLNMTLLPGTYNVSVWVYVPSGQPQFANQWRFNADAQTTDESTNAVVSGEYDTWVRADVEITITATRSQIDFNITTWNGSVSAWPVAGAVVYLCGAQISQGSDLLDYQRTEGAYDITQTGFDSDWYIYSNGTQWMTFDVASFGDTSLFAAPGQQFTVGFKASALPAGSDRSVLAKSGATDNLATLRHGLTSNGENLVNLRGVDDAIGADLDDGSPHTVFLRWNGSAGSAVIDGTASSVSAGSASEEVTNITFLCHNAASPAGIAQGYFVPLLIDKALSQSDMNRIFA